MFLIQIITPHLAGTIAQGNTNSTSVVVTNPGNTQCMTYVRFSYPVNSSTTGAAESVYIWSVNKGWLVLEEDPATQLKDLRLL